MDDDLGVRARPEAMAERRELVPQSAVVVDLSVEDDVDAAVLVGDRLITGLEIDHAQPGDAERNPPLDVIAEGVGTAVPQRADHALDDRAVGAITGRQQESGDPTHDAASTLRLAHGYHRRPPPRRTQEQE